MPAEMNRIVPIARMHGVMVIEDCAHAFMATYRGKRAGARAGGRPEHLPQGIMPHRGVHGARDGDGLHNGISGRGQTKCRGAVQGNRGAGLGLFGHRSQEFCAEFSVAVEVSLG